MTKFDSRNFDRKINRVEGLTDAVIDDVYQYFVKQTPRDSGNARRNTKLNKHTIEAGYDYASILDAGRRRENGRMLGSRQAPQGMTKPTIKQAERLIRQELKRRGGK